MYSVLLLTKSESLDFLFREHQQPYLYPQTGKEC